MQIINQQPGKDNLGDILKKRLIGSPGSEFSVLAAFAKNSGVLRVKEAISCFKKEGGVVNAFIGIDNHITTVEALLNLHDICDELFVIHSESQDVIFHQKIYCIENQSRMWLNIGSHNLTAGGLWTNIEGSICLEFDKGDDVYSGLLAGIADMKKYYRDETGNPFSIKIACAADIEMLRNFGYVFSEKKRFVFGFGDDSSTPTKKRLFGKHEGEKIKAPAKTPAGDIVTSGIKEGSVQAVEIIMQTDSIEQFWFETRSMTGGSRNILDLSKLGTIVTGSAAGMRYETTNSSILLGGVAFFDISPEDTSLAKDITINFYGLDYYPNHIVFAPDNGSWRIQLRGKNVKGEKLHTVFGAEWLKNKVLVFTKVNSGYYSMEYYDETNISHFESISTVVARNGSGKDSKKYGVLAAIDTDSQD